MLAYLLWRVCTGLHKSITLSFLIAGHTKFSPDGGFGLVKRAFKRTKVNCLHDIEKVVSSSSVNTPQLVGKEDGTVLVKTHDWTKFLENYFKKLPGIMF